MLTRRHTHRLGLLFACVLGASCSSASGGGGGAGGAGVNVATGGKTGSGGSTSGSGGTSVTSGGSSGSDPTGGTSGAAGSSSGTGGTAGSATGGVDGTATGGSPAAGGGGGSPSGSGGTDASTGEETGTPSTDGGSSGGPLTGTHVIYLLHETMPGGSATDPSRKSLEDILNSMKDSHGVVVKKVDSATPASQMPDASLIFIGPNASMFEKHPAPDLKTSTVPIIISKDGNTTEIGLGNVVNTPAIYDTIKIIKNDHPLAAGLPLGNVKVNTSANAQRMVRIQNVGPDAIKIAVSLVDNNSWSIVAYEKGATMAGGFKAPAKRMGLFWHRPSAATDDGAKLVKAAVDWMLRP